MGRSIVKYITNILKNGHYKYKYIHPDLIAPTKYRQELIQLKLQHETFENEVVKTLNHILIPPIINIITDYSTL